MPDKKKISELQSVVLGNSDYFAVAHDNDGVRESGKVSTTEIGQKVNGGIEYSGIRKTIIDHQNPIAALNDLQNYIIDSVLPSDSVSASLATIPDGADDVPLKSWKSTIVPIQASGTPSPSNPLPITGRTQIVATRTGKNLLGGSKLLANAQAYISGTTDTENKTFTFSANTTPDTSKSFSGDLTYKFKASTQYTFIFTGSGSSSTPRMNIRVYYTDGTYSTLPNPSSQNVKETVVLVSSSGKTVRSITKYSGSGSTTLYYDECGVFEGVLTAADFEAYVAESKTISLGQTVYGGELNITTGEGVSDWINIDSYDGETISEPWLCSEAEYAPGTTPPTGSQVVYKATSGTQFTTTAEEFRTLKGDNGFYTDCGDSTVEYRADIALYIANNSGGGNRSLGLMMSPSPTPTEETREEEETEQEEVDNGNNQR